MDNRTVSSAEQAPGTIFPFADQIDGTRRELIMDKAEWHEGVKQEVARIQNGGESDGLSVIFVDINNFKSVNDTHGHLEGDQVIDDFEELLGWIASSFRIVPNHHRTETDTLSYSKPPVEAGKVGGDEFAALCHTDEKGASEVVKRIIHVFDDYMNREDKAHLKKLGIGLAIGVSSLRPGMTASDLLREADTEMFADKEAQRPEFTNEQEKIVRVVEQELGQVGLNLADIHKYRRRPV